MWVPEMEPGPPGEQPVSALSHLWVLLALGHCGPVQCRLSGLCGLKDLAISGTLKRKVWLVVASWDMYLKLKDVICQPPCLMK